MTGAATSPFRRHAVEQARFCAQLGAPFTAALCRLLGDRIAPASPLGARLDNWPGDPATDALVLRLAGGLHAAVLDRSAPALAGCYPPEAMPDPDRLWGAAEAVLLSPEFDDWLERAPQTNEVGRTGPLAAGMLVIAAETGLPLDLLELGASAGLNLLPDRGDLWLGTVRAGDPASPLRIAPSWQGGNPPAVPLKVAARRGIDRDPLSAVADATRLLAYIWPDQPERLERMRAALALAAADPPPVQRGEAADFVERNAHPKHGVAVTAFHSIAFPYFGAANQARIARHMETAGARATRAAPLAWLGYEMPDPANPSSPELRLRLWPGGADRLLAVGHPHGSALTWRL